MSKKKSKAQGNETPVPYGFAPREYQLPALMALESGINRACLIWHRRAGKDLCFLNHTIKQMFSKVGAYYYFFPTYAQGKKVIWDGMDNSGRQFLDYFPPGTIKRKDSQDLQVTLLNGSLFQIIGTDKFDNIRGTNPVGCVFSEYAIQNKRAWDLVRPILDANGGWAAFIYTPMGKNHGYQMYQMAKDDPRWYSEILTVRDTYDESGKHIVTKYQVEQNAKEGMEDELIQQEFYCSFSGCQSGSYYSKVLAAAQESGRVGNVPYDPMLQVNTAWDIGTSDSTAIWFYQQCAHEIRFIDYYENSGEGLEHYTRVLQNKGYVYGTHYFPHDMAAREFTSGKSRMDVAKELLRGQRLKLLPKSNPEDRIEIVRGMFPRFWFDKEKCADGIECVSGYRKIYDEKRQEFKPEPFHDWASHGADALGHVAIAIKPQLPDVPGYGFGGIHRLRPTELACSGGEWMT